MIVTFDQLRGYRQAVTMVDGGFDPLHQGHIDYFREASALGLPVLCNLASDDYVQRKHPPLLDVTQRAAIVNAVRYVDFVHVSAFDTETVLRELQPTFYVKGKDWEGRLPAEQVAICQEHGIKIVYLDTVRDSSTRMLERWQARHHGHAAVAAFETLAWRQRATPPSHYDEEYFTGHWRDGGDSYALEARRRIEGKHPELIRDVFHPRRVLDMGCGPGALMLLLQEVGVTADGIDFSARGRELAPPEVRDRIVLRSITDPQAPEASYDLVICREVFEHLTVLDVVSAVRAICRTTSRFAYVTTRFHPEPPSLLDIATQFDVDPTHITLLNKDFLRLLFVLEGMRARPDLEARMDWLGKGRVLVYERLA